MKKMRIIATLIALAGVTTSVRAQQPHLHVENRWDECSIQFDPSLTQDAFRQFTQEAGLVAYFRPLTSAKPLGAKHFEISVLQWKTGIDSHDAAWNDTFVHPDSTHWLFEGSGLAFPGLTGRVGITKKLDVGLYWTQNVNANYGFFGGQVQYNLVDNQERKWAAAVRGNYTQLYGPEDVNLNVYGLDLLASKEFTIHPRWASVSPYATVSTVLSHGHEKTSAVDLKDETVMGVQGAIGAAFKLSVARIGVEYNFAKVNTLSFKVGIGF